MVDLRVSRKGKTFTIVASQTTTSSNTGTTAVHLPWIPNGVYFMLDLTAQDDDNDDTLDIQVQTSLGGFWIDVTAFSQVLGDGNPRKYMSDLIQTSATQANSNPGVTLAANAQVHLIGDAWRARWQIVDPTGSDASFTFSIIASVQ